ncbi:MAG: response regulator [Puniceicoccales bacterium]
MPDPITILLADDDIGHRTLMKRNLRRSNVANELFEFMDGQAVWDYLCQSKEDGTLANRGFLVLLDIRMPKLTGIEVLRRMKQDEYLRLIPVIMVTTTDDPGEVERCHELGCNSYITKPIAYEQFIEAIRNIGLFISIVQVPRLQ